MKNKAVKVISIFGLTVLIIAVISFTLYMYDMHNGKVARISVYEEPDYTEVFDGFFEQGMQELFESSGIERQTEAISTPQQAKKLAQKIFYEMYGLESVTVYRPYNVYHDDESEMWFIQAEHCIDKLLPFMFGSEYCLLVTDNGYIIASFML